MPYSTATAQAAWHLERRAPGGTCSSCGRLFASDRAFDRHASRRAGCYSDAELRARRFVRYRGVWRLRTCRRCRRPVFAFDDGLGRYCRQHLAERQAASRRALVRRRRPARPCAHCGATIAPSRSAAARYCSPLCKSRADNVRRRNSRHTPAER